MKVGDRRKDMELATLVTIVFLTKQLGENSTTSRDPVAVYDPDGAHAGITFKEVVHCCLNSGDDRLVATQKYGTVEKELPAWLSPEEWLRRRTAWKWAWGCGCDMSWPEAWQRYLAYDCGVTARRLAVVKLLKTKRFRSEFRQSLRDRLDEWLASDEKEYDSPFSPKQWECLTRYEHHEARCVDSTLYYSGR
jgi:hypothetical protein